MSKQDSTAPASSGKPTKPNKPYPEFPLTAHPAGYWCKKIRGKVHYFGPWEDPDGALAKYLEQKDALHAGRKPREDTGALTVKQLANAFLGHKQALLDADEIKQRTWNEYKAASDLVVSHFGKSRLVTDLGPDDFASLRKKMAKSWGPVTLGNTIQRVRSLFKYAMDNGLIDRPVRYGQGFARPSKKTLRLERAKKGPRMFEAEEIRRILAEAGIPLRAMVLLGINCGFGNADCGNLPLSALDLERGWVNFPRPKTGIGRRCPLWPETVETLKAILEKRPSPKAEEDSGLLFITKYGKSWYKEKIIDNPITKEMRKLLDSLGIDGNRNFYALRHTFETIGGEARD
jgi:integrase